MNRTPFPHGSLMLLRFTRSGEFLLFLHRKRRQQGSAEPEPIGCTGGLFQRTLSCLSGYQIFYMNRRA
jgi:hypothetical protein